MGKENVVQICKICGKSFKNIRALCGHKRCHSSVTNNANKGLQEPEFQLGVEENNQKCFEFGENSKKKGGRNLKFLCQKCDRGFKSFRALHGHMRLHSKREIGLKNDLKFNTPREKRSKRRYKINTTSNNYSFCSNFNHFGTKLSVSSIVDEEELMEIASCLLMLAKGGFCLADNVSVESEISAQGRVDVIEPSCDDNDSVIKTVNIDDLETNCDDLKTEILDYNSDVSKIRQENIICRDASTFEDESKMYVAKLEGEITGTPQEGLIFGRVLESKACDHTLGECNCDLTGLNLNTCGQTDAMLKYICNICEKGFHSGQALGGHRLHCPRSKRSRTSETDIQPKPVASQKRGVKGETLEIMQSENDIQPKPVAIKKFGLENVKLGDDHGKKRARKKICLVCSKTFGSGQALGGHMRAHFQGNAQSCETKTTEAIDHEISGQIVSRQSMAHLLGNPQSCEKKNDAFENEIPEAGLVPVA